MCVEIRAKRHKMKNVSISWIKILLHSKTLQDLLATYRTYIVESRDLNADGRK